MGIISWIVIGAIAGWLASIVTKRNDRMGCNTNIIADIVSDGAAVCTYPGEEFRASIKNWADTLLPNRRTSGRKARVNCNPAWMR